MNQLVGNELSCPNNEKAKGNLDLIIKSNISIDRESSSPGTDSPAPKTRRLSLRSKRSFDCSFELWDESYFATERKVSQLAGLHYAAFSTNKQNRPYSLDLIDLVEDQGVTCLDADNPDRWVVRIHPSQQKLGSFYKQLRTENVSSDSQIIDENENSVSVELLEPALQEPQSTQGGMKRIGRVNAVCLTRHPKSAQRGKRNPREAFREDVISFSNKQQEARMKIRYALTELSDTEIEYSRALKQLTDVLDSLSGKIILNQPDGSEKIIDYPSVIDNDVRGLQATLSRIVQFSGTFLEKLPVYALEPGRSAECFTKDPDRWYDYTMFLILSDHLINHTLQTTSQDTEISFSLSILDSAQKTQNAASDQSDLSSQRNSISFRNLLDLIDVPRHRLNAYGGLLRDIARYIARDGSSTRNLELAMINVTRAQRRAEEFIHLWSQVDEDFNQLFSSENLNDNNSLFGKQIPPPITRITDVKIGQHKGIQIDASEMEIERLILLPNHLLSLKSTNVNDSTCHWKLNRIINLDELRVGDLGNEGSDQTSFELWNVSGEDPLKLIFRITCSEIISRNAWVEDLRYAIKEKIECSTESTNVAKTVVDSHINRFWDLQKRFTGIMELSPFHSESVSEIYFDALENVQHISSQSVESSQLSQTDKDGLIRTTFNQKSTSSSSYYTADEPVDDVGKDRIASANLFESYSTLDGVQTPFSEDQQSLTDFQMSPDIRGNQSQLPLRSSLAGNDTLVKQLTVHAGEQIQFNASFTISGPVAYETSWFMNGAPVKPDIGAEMILSDRDTRLLIANADPLMHSGTYTCKCRLFEGTETAVYFCVNVLTAKLSQSDSNENESEQLKLTNIIKSNIFCPVTKELDLPIGKSLEIEVKIDEENVLKFMNTENIQVQWYQDGLLLKPGSTCEMIKSNDRFILRSTSNNLQPDKLYTYTCALKLPDNSFISTAPSLTIPVRLHYPTVKELESELKMNMHKNSSKVNNISIRHVELTKNEAFRLTVPIENNPQNQDCIVWWTNKDKLLAGSHLPPKNTDYEFLVEPNLKANELMFKLFKPSTESEDSGTYRCWIISQSVRNNIVHCADITVIVSNVVSNERHSEEEGEESEGMKTKLEEERQSQENGIKEEETEGEGQKEIGEETKLQDETDEAKRLAEEAESRRRQKEEDEEKKKMEELERKRIEEEEAKRLAEEAESRRRQKEEDEEKKKMEELERKRIEEEEAKRLAEEAESRRRQKEEDEEKKKMEELERKRIEEEEAKRLAEEAESKRRQKEEDKEKKEKPSKLEKEKGEDTHMKSPEKEGKKPKDIGREEAEEKGSDSEEEEKKKKRKRSKSALKGGTAHRTKQIEQSDNKITEKDKSCNKKEELLTEGELKIQEQIKESDRQEDKAIQLKKPVEKDDILGDQLQMTGESMMTNYLQIKSHTHEDQDNTKHLVEASDAIQLEQSKSELESSEDRVVKFDNITSRKDKREKFESQNTNATEEKITICNLKIKSQTDDNQLGALKLDENSDVQKSKIDKSEIETTKEDGEKSYRKIHGSKDKEANKKEKHKEREEPKDRNTLYVAQESRTESSDSYEPKFEPTNKQDRKLKRRESKDKKEAKVSIEKKSDADTSMDYQFISVEKDGQVSESICAREISYQEQSKEENIELEMHVKQTENVEDTTSYTSPGAVPVTKDQMEENEDSRKKHEEQNTEKRAKKDKPKRKKHHERELTKDTTNLESEIRKESKISGGQDNQTTALIGNDQQQQNRKTQKSLVGIEDDVSEDEKQTLSTEEEYRNAMGKNLKVDEKEVGKKMKNRRKSKEVKELELKKVQTGRLNNIFYEDENCDVNVVCLKPITEFNKDESVLVKQGTTVCLTTHLDLNNDSVSLQPCDFIVLLNGKPIEFNGNQQPLLTIEQNVAQLVLESLSPNQGGIYELRLRKAIEDSLNAQEEVNESTYVANMADFIPSSRFPLIYVEPEKVLPKGEDAKYIHDKSKQQKIFLAELLPKYICMQGETLKLAVELKNNVLVKDFEWLVNGKPVDPESSTDFVVWQTGNWIALTIPNVRSDLTGTYTLHIDTPSGRYTTTGDLSVTGQKRQMTQYVPSQVEGLKPLFTKRLQDYTADVNETVRLSARLVAEPPATIIWKHNGIPVQNDNRVKIHDDHINPSIIIQNVKDEDYGEYICLATNVLGQAETKANLYIQSTFYETDGYATDTSGVLDSVIEPSRCSALPVRVNNVQLVEMYDGGFKIAWDPIPNERVTYNVEISNDAGRWWKPVLTNLHEVSADISNDIACPLNPVQVRVVAENEYGLGPPCVPLIRLPIRGCLPHMQAIKPETEFEEATAVRIRWSPAVPSLPPSQIHKSGILNQSQLLGKVTYAVEIREGSQSEWCRVANDLSDLSYTHHLRPGVSYAIRIVAKNKFGESCPTPMAIVQLDPNSLLPDLSLDSPWVAVTYPMDNISGKKCSVKLFWKAAYLPDYCDNCIKGLKPLYRIEWRRGKSGHWLELARDISEYESGYPLPRDMVDSLIKETQATPDLLLNTMSLNHSIEFRVISYNEFGESGPTKSYRLKASQIFRGQNYRSNLQLVDTLNSIDQYEHLSVLDKLPIITSTNSQRLEVQVTSVDPREGIALKWTPNTNSKLSNGADNNYDSHSRYRIQRTVANSTTESLQPDMKKWTVVNKEDGLVYGEEYVIDVRPNKAEQFLRILTLQEDKEGNHTWLDNHEVLRIPSLHELCPPAPSKIEVKLIPPLETTGSEGVCVTWRPSKFQSISDDSYLKHIKNHDQIDYRIESRTTLSDMAPWRQVGLISGSLCKIDDRKAEPGSQLIYRITPINQFGEGPSLCSAPIRLPLLLTSLERCIEDLRFLVLGPNTIQLRWRLGDAIIDALGFRRNSKQSRDCMKQLDLDESAEMCGRVNFSIEKRDGYAGEWYAIHEQISGNLLNKIVLDNFSYLDRDISCRIVAHVDGQQTKPSRPISISIKTDYLVPDFSALKPHVNVTSVEEYLISWEDPDVQSMYTSHILNLTIPKVLNKETSYAVQIQHEGSTEWTTLTSDLHTTQWTWNQPNPLVGYHVRILPSNQFGAGHPTRSTLISPQVVIPDLTYMRPSVESPSEILKGRVAPELVWQIPKSYALDRTFTPYTFEVQVKGVEKSTNRDRIKLEMNNAKLSKDASRTSDSEYIWRVLASGLKRNRLSLEHLDPEQEYWLRVVAVTEYGRSTPSQPVRKMADLNARRNRCSSASIGVLHEPTPTSPTFTEPNTSMIYAPVYGHVELKCVFRPVHPEHETRFTWYFNGKLLDADVSSAYPTLNQKFYSTVSKSGDTAILHLNGIGENDFGTYICKAVHMMGTGEKEFIVKMADAPVFLEVPTPLLTVKLHSRFELRCLIDALPPPTIIWTRDSKRVVESHRTQIGKGDRRLVNRTPSISTCDFSTDATLSIDKCIHQDAGLYTLIAENIAGRVMTSCLIHVEENPVPANITLRWTNIEEHYFVLRRLEHDSSSEVRLLIDKKTNSEYIGKLFNLDNPTSRINGAREMECLTRLCHKNVLKLVDALISDNVLILVCEKLSGSNLLDSVLACENWSEMAAAAIIRSVLEALEHIHSQGVVHYDIQPDNLLFVRKTIGDNDFTNSSNNSDLLRALAPLVTDVLSQTDRHKMNVFSNLLKVIGFSTAQTYITNSQDRIACMPPLRYRPEYVSPEILLSIKKTDGPNTEVVQTYCENLGPAADIWSLGVLTYVLLVGWPPFVDYESGDILTDNILQAIIPFDIPEFENISEEGKDFISKLLQVDPTKRLSAKECLTHPWIQLFSNYEIKSEYILRKLKKYKEFYNSVHPVYIANDDRNYSIDLKNRIAAMIRHSTPSEDTVSVLSSGASSVFGLQDNSESYSEDQSQLLDRYGSHDFNESLLMIPSSTHIPTAADASESVLEKFNLERQNTLTETTQLEETTYPLLTGQESTSANIEHENQATSATHDKTGKKFSAPVFASLLRDAYFSVHTREARFTCQLASAPYIPEGIHGHDEALKELYPSGVTCNDINKSSSAAAAWYLGGCLLSDGPGVSLGAGHSGWLWLCLSDLRPEQDRSVVECVVRNRAGKSRTKARLLLADIPKPPGRPGLIDIRPTAALISWLSSTPDSNEDLIYRVDIKYSDSDNESAKWHRHGFTVDCRYLVNDLKPGMCYRVRVSAGNTFGWGNYSIASSDFRTPNVSLGQTPNILSTNEQAWIFNWRQSTNIYALSDHPVALQYAVDQLKSVPPPPDKVLQKLHRHNGIIPSLDVLKSVCRPIRLINKGTYTKLVLGKTHPMLSVGANYSSIRQNTLSLPPRLLSKITYINSEDTTLLQKARREALILTILHGASGGMSSSLEDYFGEQDSSYLFTSQRQLLPSGWSFGWLANDAVKPTEGITVMQWIPGGRLIDVLCSRVEYTEFSVMMWCQQILMALRWFHTCFLGQPHGNICPEHILIARRTSSLPDIVLTGFGQQADSTELQSCFTAPELYEDQPKSIASDLWSVGAVIRLLLTGENSSDINTNNKKVTSSSPTNSEEIHTRSQGYLNIKKLKKFSKPARKFVYNCLNPVPKKRGTVDFWLDSHWFDLNADNVNNLTSAIIPTNILRSFKTLFNTETNPCVEEETEELQFS